jgi:four helix bundle protein
MENGGPTMGYKSFEDLPVWNAAIDLAVRTFEMTATGGLDRYAGLRGQIERAAVSVSNNIAEGFDRGTHEELLSFLYIALGSAGEVRSMLRLIERIPGAEPVRPHVGDLLALTQSVSRQLGAWIESLKGSDRRGPRFENGATRDNRQKGQRARAFLDELEQIKAQARNRPQGDHTDE